MTTLRLLFLPALSALVFAACSDDAVVAPAKDPGSLLAVSLTSTVGVLLDELPPAAHARAVAELAKKDTKFWEERIKRQIEATAYRLVFRNLFFEPEEGKGILPLPPVESWKIALAGTPALRTIDGHEHVAVDYTFTSTLLGPESQAILADLRLSGPGTFVEEDFVLPVDPEHILERTGFACMNESDFPPNSVDTENARLFYDHGCEADTLIADDGCHLSLPIPTESCPDAVKKHVGAVTTVVRFERLAWDQALADSVRVGEQLPGVAELRAMPEGVADNRIVYRYFPADSCAISEGCVGAAGWRRLLQFTATVQNLGALDAALGDVGPGSAPVANNLVSLSDCHGHMHFNHYGNFAFGDGAAELGSKRAFCLESTWRYFNNEDTPFTHPYTCHYQGTAAGWGDDYIAGLDCQWVDITPIDTTAKEVVSSLSFHVNPDKFLCEGTVKTDAAGNTLYEPTEFKTEGGELESRIGCNELDGASDNNIATSEVTVPIGTGGLVTEPCTRGQLGPTRNCGFAAAGALISCTPGMALKLNCSSASADKPVAVRVCEASQVLGAIPCAYREAIAVATMTDDLETLELTCPVARSTAIGETGGTFGVYVAPLLDGDDAAVICTLD
ncbi:MAG: hypothetical protein EXR75_04095 [Myxococcales bacterium]|nr:hypothetical protein [Myxococcales bacterium]